jgi:HEPN domain-containing protein
MLNKRKITRTHDLVKLLDDCIAIQDDVDFETLRDDCQTLTHYRVEFAYPGPIPEQISVDEARSAIEKARRIHEFVRNKAELQGYSSK